MASVLASALSAPGRAWPVPRGSVTFAKGENHAQQAAVHTIANPSPCVSFYIQLASSVGAGARPVLQLLFSWSPDQWTCLTGVLLTLFEPDTLREMHFLKTTCNLKRI